MNDKVASAKDTDAVWRALYITGGIAAVAAVLVFRRYFSVELMQFDGLSLFTVPAAWPESAAEWFALFHQNPIVGLLLFDLFDLVNYGLVGLIFLALYGALRDVHKSGVMLAMVCAFVGIAVYFASNQTFAMANLSERFASTTLEAERAILLAAGEALLAIHSQGTGIQLSLFLLLLAGLIISIVMLVSEIFNKAAAIAGILANGLGLAYYFTLPFISEYSWLFPTISAPFRMIWYILIAIKLFQLARGKN